MMQHLLSKLVPVFDLGETSLSPFPATFSHSRELHEPYAYCSDDPSNVGWLPVLSLRTNTHQRNLQHLLRKLQLSFCPVIEKPCQRYNTNFPQI